MMSAWGTVALTWQGCFCLRSTHLIKDQCRFSLLLHTHSIPSLNSFQALINTKPANMCEELDLCFDCSIQQPMQVVSPPLFPVKKSIPLWRFPKCSKIIPVMDYELQWGGELTAERPFFSLTSTCWTSDRIGSLHQFWSHYQNSECVIEYFIYEHNASGPKRLTGMSYQPLKRARCYKSLGP